MPYYNYRLFLFNQILAGLSCNLTDYNLLQPTVARNQVSDNQLLDLEMNYNQKKILQVCISNSFIHSKSSIII